MLARRFLVFISILWLGAGVASAQTVSTDSRWAVSGIGGFGRTWDDESLLGTGILIGGRAEARIAGGLWFEGGVDWLRHNRDVGALRAEGHTTFLTGALKFKFGPDEGHGYVMGGPVVGFLKSTSTFESLSREVEANGFGYAVGAGAAFAPGPRFEVGPEFRFLMLTADEEEAPSFAIYGGVRIAFRR